MLKFSPEEHKHLNLTEQDSKNMKSLVESSEAVLHMTADEAARSLRFTSQERIFEEAKRIPCNQFSFLKLITVRI